MSRAPVRKKGKETILGTVKNIIPEAVKVTSIRQSDALGLGHAVHTHQKVQSQLI